MMSASSSTLRLAAIGDLLLTTRPGESRPGRGMEALSEEVRKLFASCDIVLANLECTFPGKELVATEPRVFSSESQISGLAEAGIHLVSLANNHAFDGGDEGFKQFAASLANRKVGWFGAGLTLSEANRPFLLNIRDVRLAIIGFVDPSSGMHRFAAPAASGVPRLDCEDICRQIKDLRKQVDHIILSPHWGHERFRFPSPDQIRQARLFIDSGASLVAGHHPHVVQGMEFYRKSPIAYSLGNFFVNPVHWDNGDFLTFSRFEKTGCILLVEMDRSGIRDVKQIPAYDDGKVIDIDKSGKGERYLRKANRMLIPEVTSSRYRRESFRVHTLLPIFSHFRWEKLRRIRPSHFNKALKLFFEQWEKRH